jgi:dTDP-4-dehydrorhamnose reductase
MKIILFGSNGMLGRYVFIVLKEKYQIECITRDKYDIENDTWDKLNLLLKNIVKKGDVIINCAGIIPQKYNSTNYKTYIKVNTLFPHKLNELSNIYDGHFIHITTDCVYDGKKGSYSIEDEHNAKDIYGVSKSLGEPHNATVIRTSIIGEELTGKKSLIEWVKSNKDSKINGYTNHYWNGVTCLTLANFIKAIIDNSSYWKGVKHICSDNIVSKYELCCYINEIYKLNINIEKYEDSISKNMTLSGNSITIRKNIYQQIEELYYFNL